METTNDILKEAIYKHISYQHEPITTSEVACAMGITSQKASALLQMLCYEKRIKWRPYHGQKGYGIDKTIFKKVCNCEFNNINTSIAVDWEVMNESIVEFEIEKPISYKEKIIKIIYEILLDYFN